MKVSIEFLDLDDFEAWIRWRSMRGQLDAFHAAARNFLKHGADTPAEGEEIKRKLLQRAVVVIGTALYE